MSENEALEFVSATIDEVLLSIASGLVEAQAQLATLHSLDARGLPGPTYLLPELEFELRVATKVSKTEGRPTKLLVRPLQPSEAVGGAFQAEIVSTLRGRFVSIPPNQGVPPLTSTSNVTKLDSHLRRIEVEVRAGGQPVPGIEVHFNVDAERSRTLSELDEITLESLGPATALAPATARTDTRGWANTELVLDPGAPSGASIVVVVDVGDRSESLVIVV